MDVASLFSVEGKTVLVTGGSRGIGEMLARGFVAAGAHVLIASRSAEACDALAEELSGVGDCTSLPADLSTEAGVDELARAVAERAPSLDVLINNAGAVWGEPFDTYSTKGWDKVLDLNVRSVFLLTQALAPQLRAAGTPEDPARVINIGSIDGIRVPQLPTFAYSASKAAVHQLTRHLGAALAPDHITVNAIAPGLFPSKMTEPLFSAGADLAASIPLRRAGSPEDIAGTAIYLASRAGAYTTGAVVVVDGGVATLV